MDSQGGIIPLERFLVILNKEYFLTQQRSKKFWEQKFMVTSPWLQIVDQIPEVGKNSL